MIAQELPFKPHHSRALHEAGHAVFAVCLHRALLRLSIIPDGEGGGLTEHTPLS
jgi:ATP-dependent Zn protease